jgi:hypothetical protein
VDVPVYGVALAATGAPLVRGDAPCLRQSSGFSSKLQKSVNQSVRHATFLAALRFHRQSNLSLPCPSTQSAMLTLFLVALDIFRIHSALGLRPLIRHLQTAE